MRLDNYSRVRITTDRCAAEGVRAGDIGYIIEVYQAAVDVEFSRKEGTTIAIVTLAHDEVEPDPEPDAE